VSVDSPTAVRSDASSGDDFLPDIAESGLTPDIKSSVRILVVDDDRTLLDSCTSVLKAEGYNCATARRAEEALSLVGSRTFDVALIDLYLGDTSGIELLGQIRGKQPDILPVIITGRASVDSGIESMRAGAWDYLPKPFSALQLSVLLGRAAYRIHAGRELRNRATRAVQAPMAGETNLLGVSRALRQAVEAALQAAPTDASVFVTGESGTGKELIARFIHEQSRRSRRAFVPVNCAALPDTLLESEMFGYRRGAFTGAVRDKRGLLETAHQGTIFLDEIGEMSPVIQTKLLRVVQDGVVRRLGSEVEDAVVDVRFISATNRDPEEALKEGVLRPDLFYRLKVVPIHLPSLAERPEDIPVLSNHFLVRYWQRHRGSAQEPPHFSESALDLLVSQPWPGNVRELQNVIEHLTVLAEPGSAVGAEHIPIAAAEGDPSTPRPRRMTLAPFHEAKSQFIEQFEREYLANLVASTAGNMSEAARRAQIDRTTLYRLMCRHGLTRSALMGEIEDEAEAESK
jgi:DNA-binding NtrC family response regulator